MEFTREKLKDFSKVWLETLLRIYKKNPTQKKLKNKKFFGYLNFA
jgi:hypothetical protein